MSELKRFEFTAANGKVMTFPADDKDHSISGYAFFGDDPWLIHRLEVICERPELLTTVQLKLQGPNPSPPVAIVRGAAGKLEVVYTPAVVEWPAHITGELVARATGAGTQTVRVIVSYEPETYTP